MKYYLIIGIIFSIYSLKIAHRIPLRDFIASFLSCLIVAMSWPIAVAVMVLNYFKNKN